MFISFLASYVLATNSFTIFESYCINVGNTVPHVAPLSADIYNVKVSLFKNNY